MDKLNLSNQQMLNEIRDAFYYLDMSFRNNEKPELVEKARSKLIKLHSYISILVKTIETLKGKPT